MQVESLGTSIKYSLTYVNINTLVTTVQVESLGTSIKYSFLSLLISILLSASLLIINVFEVGCNPGM